MQVGLISRDSFIEKFHSLWVFFVLKNNRNIVLKVQQFSFRTGILQVMQHLPALTFSGRTRVHRSPPLVLLVDPTLTFSCPREDENVSFTSCAAAAAVAVASPPAQGSDPHRRIPQQEFFFLFLVLKIFLFITRSLGPPPGPDF